MDATAIFLVAGTRVIDAHHDDLLQPAFSDQPIGGLVQFPAAPAEAGMRPRGTEDVLSVVQVENRITALGFAIVGWRQINAHRAAAAEVSRRYLFFRQQFSL